MIAIIRQVLVLVGRHTTMPKWLVTSQNSHYFTSTGDAQDQNAD
jgi:hypothetical protein